MAGTGCKSIYGFSHTPFVVSSTASTPVAVDLPEPDLPTRLACQVIARETDLDRAILESLAAGPRRYTELKPLLGDRNDHNLTKVLKRLVEDGLIDRRTQARQRPTVHRYELTALGERVLELARRIEALTA